MEGDSVDVTVASNPAQIEIAGLTADSRQVEPGFLFAAIPGNRADGRDFIGGAVERGAVAILAPPGAGALGSVAGLDRQRVALIVDENPRRRFALMAARFFSEQPSTVAAVTGTNGKTSVVWFLRQIWAVLGYKAASLGTLGLHAPDVQMNGRLTTPDPVELHRTLTRLKGAGVDHLAMEASSHGLAQYRLDGVRVTAAAFTNLSRDHLDYHGSADAYLAAKARLFSDVIADGGTAVLNADSADAADMAAIARRRNLRVLTFGTKGRDIRLDGIETVDDGQRLTVTVDGETVPSIVAAGGRLSGMECPLRIGPRDGHWRRTQGRLGHPRNPAGRAGPAGMRGAFELRRPCLCGLRPYPRCAGVGAPRAAPARTRGSAGGGVRLRWRPRSGQAIRDGTHRRRIGGHGRGHRRQSPRRRTGGHSPADPRGLSRSHRDR
jgi:UDP-N-acetylmuramoyl-L-alanyl-D-glutamate--2,6-diaminopimelate ligase